MNNILKDFSEFSPEQKQFKKFYINNSGPPWKFAAIISNTEKETSLHYFDLINITTKSMILKVEGLVPTLLNINMDIISEADNEDLIFIKPIITKKTRKIFFIKNEIISTNNKVYTVSSSIWKI
ncbi:hypothetical protein OAK17_04400 [Alphaproteobacteria bacterium]|nr:hypothetical protein [Alphaproteobacteria bacterium]